MTCEKYDKLTLLSYVTGDLSVEKRSDLEAHLKRCSVCAGFIRRAEEERSSFLGEYPSIDVVPMKNRKLFRFTPVRTAFALAATLVIAVGTASLLVNRSGDGYRIKGDIALNLFAQDGSGAPVVREQQVFSPGERIQFTYSCGGERYFILASIDDSGRVSVFYPAEGDSSMLLEPGSDLPLPNSIVLDEYIGKELFIAVFSARPLQVAAVVGRVRKGFTEGKSLDRLTPSIANATIKSILLTKKEHRR